MTLKMTDIPQTWFSTEQRIFKVKFNGQQGRLTAGLKSREFSTSDISGENIRSLPLSPDVS